MKNFLKKIRENQIYIRLTEIIKNLNHTERAYFYILCVVFVISGLVIINNMNKSFMINEPAEGGSFSEGIVGSPRFINPVLSTSDLDRDLSSLIYSGLLKIGPDNTLLPDLAESYEISSDSLTYTFTLKDKAYFSDGEKVTADDIIFTINKIQDSVIKSPKRPAFYDVSIEKTSDNKIQFTLKKPYPPFLQNLTVGILPKKLWGNFSSDEFTQSQLNLDPIGSGPYKVGSYKTSQNNMLVTRTSYELVPFNKYVSIRPYIDKIDFKFYKDEGSLIDAYNSGAVEAISSISPNKISSLVKQNGQVIKTSPLPRVFGTFFNQSQSEVLAQKEVRQALDLSVDKQKIVDQVLSGYGNTINGPIPKGLLGDEDDLNVYDPNQASLILGKAGWTKGADGVLQKVVSKKKTLRLTITISTLNSPDLSLAADLIKQDWEKIGASVDIKKYDFGDLEQNIIRPRKFEALLYGMVIGRDLDFFAFWHSSQRNDPGLNISMYANSKVDKLLEDARKVTDDSKRTDDYLSFEKEVKNDVPAVFLYSPDFIYVIPDKIKNTDDPMITLPYERFQNIDNWYIETNNLWKIFQ